MTLLVTIWANRLSTCRVITVALPTYRVGQKYLMVFKLKKMESILPFYVNFLQKFSLSQSILITIFSSRILCLWGGVPSCQRTPASVSGILHHSLQHAGRNCCHFVRGFLFEVLRCPSILFVQLTLQISTEEVVAGIEIGRSCRPFTIPSSWDCASWERLIGDSHCEPLHHLLKPDSLDFNTKSPLLPWQPCFQRNCARSTQKMLHHIKQLPSQNVKVSDEYRKISRLSSSNNFVNWHWHEAKNVLHPSWERG